MQVLPRPCWKQLTVILSHPGCHRKPIQQEDQSNEALSLSNNFQQLRLSDMLHQPAVSSRISSLLPSNSKCKQRTIWRNSSTCIVFECEIRNIKTGVWFLERVARQINALVLFYHKKPWIQGAKLRRIDRSIPVIANIFKKRRGTNNVCSFA